MTPKNRTELVRLIEDAACEAYRQNHPEPFTMRAVTLAVLEALERAGCAVVPVVATEEMESAAQNVLYDAVGFTDYGGWTGTCRDQDSDSGQQTLTALLNASPFRSK